MRPLEIGEGERPPLQEGSTGVEVGGAEDAAIVHNLLCVDQSEIVWLVLASKRDRVEIRERCRRHFRCTGPQRLGHRPQDWCSGPSPVAGCPSPRRCPVQEQPGPHRHLTCGRRSGGGSCCAIRRPSLVVEHPSATGQPDRLQASDELVRVTGSVEPLTVLALPARADVRSPAHLVTIDGPSASISRHDFASPATEHRHPRHFERHGAPRDPMPLYRGAKWQGAAPTKSGNGAATRETGPRSTCSGRCCRRPEEGPACAVLGRSKPQRKLAACGPRRTG